MDTLTLHVTLHFFHTDAHLKTNPPCGYTQGRLTDTNRIGSAATTQALQWCHSCAAFTADQHHTAACVPAAEHMLMPLSDTGRTYIVAAQLELADLYADSRVSATGTRHSTIFNSFTKYCQCAELGERRPMSATPGMVVAFLTHTRTEAPKARTRTHGKLCPNFRLPNLAPKRGPQPGGDCLCPTHQSVGSVKGVLFALQACFRDAGIRGEWNPLHATGNPCKSKEVQALILAMAFRETNNTVSDPVMQRWTIEEVQRIIAVGVELNLHTHSLGKIATLTQRLEALRSLSAALFVSLTWASLDRGLDVLELVGNQLQIHGDTLDIYKSRSKVHRTPDKVAPLLSISPLNDGEHYDVVAIYKAFVQQHKRLGPAGADLSVGTIFRNIRVRKSKGIPPQVETTSCSTANMLTWVRSLSDKAGLSPHGLNALRRGKATFMIDVGHSWEELEDAGGWSQRQTARRYALKGLPPQHALAK